MLLSTTVINLTLFGTTTGLEVLHLPIGSNNLPVKFEDAWIEISPNMATLRADRDVVVLSRRNINGHIGTWIGLYRPAREIGYDRPGSFYGAGAWVIDKVADVTCLIETLKNLANQLQTLAMNGDRFVKRINDIHSQLVPPEQITSLSASLSNVANGCDPSGETIFIASSNSFSELLEWGQRAQSASKFSKIIIGSTEQIPESASGSSIKVFKTLAFAIDAAYQKFDAEFHDAQLLHKSTVQQYEQILLKHKSERDLINQTLAAHDMQLQQVQLRADKCLKAFRDLESENDHLQIKLEQYQRALQGSKPVKIKYQKDENKPQVKSTQVEDDDLNRNDLLFWAMIVFVFISLFVSVVKTVATEENCFLWKFYCQAPIGKKSNNAYEEPAEERNPPQIGVPQNQPINNGKK